MRRNVGSCGYVEISAGSDMNSLGEGARGSGNFRYLLNEEKFHVEKHENGWMNYE